MSTRTFDEIKEAFRRARSQSDLVELAAISEELRSFDSLEALALTKRAQTTILLVQGNYPAAFEGLYESLAQFEELADVTSVAAITSELGTTFWETGEFGKALEYMHKALALQEDNGLREGVAATTNNIGLIFADTSDYAKALEYYHRALELHIEVGNRFYQANTTGNIGLIYQNIHELPSALEFVQKALTLHQELQNKGGESNCLGSMGSIYMEMEQYDKAETWIRRAIEVAIEFGGSRHQAAHTSMLAELLARTQRFDEALKLLDDHAALFEQHPTILSGTLTTRAGIVAERGEYDEARKLLLMALEQTTARNERASIVGICKTLRDIAKTQGDLDSYVTYNEKYLEISNEVSGSDSTRRVTLQVKEREIEAQRLVQQKEREEREREREIQERERERERAILYGALPQHVADRLIRGETVTDHYDSASVLFLDIAGFTRISSHVPPGHVVHLLEAIFGACDEICQRYEIMKIKTIGDSYMAFSEIANSEQRIANAALEIQEFLATMQVTMPPELGDTSWTRDVGDIYARVGLHCGPVVAGIVGKDRLQYDVWGDTVNVASRMESTGEPGRIQVSDTFARRLEATSAEATLRATRSDLTPGNWHLAPRVAAEIKGKGVMQTYWLERA